MSCNYCGLTIGKTYNLFENTPTYTPCCEARLPIFGEEALYVRWDGVFHVFRLLHTKRCSKCGEGQRFAFLNCGNYSDDLFVRQKQDVYRKDENYE